MTEAEVRAAFIAALEKFPTAQSGRVRTEVRQHFAPSPTDASGRDVIGEVSEMIFDHDRGFSAH